MAILINNQDMIWDVWQREMITTTGESVVFLATLGGLGFTGAESITQVLGVARTVCTQPAIITATELSTGTLVRNSIQGAGKSGDVYISTDANGNPIPLAKQRVNGQDIPLPDPAAQGRPHTVLRGKISSETGELYRQSATFNGGSWPTAKGYEVPISEVHWSDHNRADVHTNPHKHVFIYDFTNKYWYRSDPDFLY